MRLFFDATAVRPGTPFCCRAFSATTSTRNEVMNAVKSKMIIGQIKRNASGFRRLYALISLYVFAGTAMAEGYGDTGTKVTGFLTNINGLLNLASIAVVTIAIIFAGYQIAFAHKRIADVAPILIGGLLIGAAAQIANMIIGDPDAGTTTMLYALPLFHA
jgi:type IV secretion system protein VirB2